MVWLWTTSASHLIIHNYCKIQRCNLIQSLMRSLYVLQVAISKARQEVRNRVCRNKSRISRRKQDCVPNKIFLTRRNILDCISFGSNIFEFFIKIWNLCFKILFSPWIHVFKSMFGFMLTQYSLNVGTDFMIFTNIVESRLVPKGSELLFSCISAEP